MVKTTYIRHRTVLLAILLIISSLLAVSSSAQVVPPTFVACGTMSASTANAVPGLPTGWLQNDIFLLFVESANQPAGIAPVGGWAEVTNSPQGTGATGGTSATALEVFWKRAGASEVSPSVGARGNHTIATVCAFRGVITTGNPWDVTNGGVEATSDTSLSATGNTTTVADALVVIATTNHIDGNTTSRYSSWANTGLASVVERFDEGRNTGNGGGIGVTTGEKASAGAYGITTATLSASGVKAFMAIALKPEPPPANQITVGTTLTQPLYVVEGNTAVVMGAFTFISSASAATVNSIKISEKGTVNANANLINAKLYAQQESTCTFAGSTQIGTTQSFSAADEATFGLLELSVGTLTQQCVFVVLDVSASAGALNNIEIEITAAGDIAATGGTITGTFPVQISGSTVIRADAGTIMSTEIDFDWAAGQTSWGKAIWSTTETEGDIKLRIYYTTATACDTIIPDSALPGNSAGFDVLQSPLSIDSLNPSTYNRICLQATLIAGTNAAPTLNQWAITWGAPAGGYVVSGTYISSPFNAGTPSAFTVIEWNWSKTNPACSSCAIRLQIQTAPDAGDAPGAWTPTWAGPEGNDGDETDYFTLSTGEMIHKDHNGNQWVRYRTTLDGDGVDTPVLEEIRIFYHSQI